MRTLIVHTDISGSFDWRKRGEPEPFVTRIITVPVGKEGARKPIVQLLKPLSFEEFDAVPIAANGITIAMCQESGVDRIEAIDELHRMLRGSSVFAAFSEDFHRRWLGREFDRIGLSWPLLQHQCLMRQATNLVRIPDMRSGNGFKWPKLAEAAEHFMGRPLEISRTDPIADGLAMAGALVAIHAGIRAHTREIAS